MIVYQVAKIAVDKTAYHYDKLYDYLIPSELIESLVPGMRVLVPFGRSNRKRTGMIMEISQQSEIQRLKPVAMQLDKEPVLSPEDMKLIDFLKHHTFCSYFDAINTLLPTGLAMRIQCRVRTNENLEDIIRSQRLKQCSDMEQELYRLIESKKELDESEVVKQFPDEDIPYLLSILEKQELILRIEESRRRILDETIIMVRLASLDAEEIMKSRFTAKQRLVIDFLSEVYAASLKEVCYYTGVTKAVVDNLAARDAVVYYENEVYRNPYQEITSEQNKEICLNNKQQEVYKRLLQLAQAELPDVALLHGITGSGKTQVYLKLAQQVITAGKGVIVMVPEIALTPQTLAKFHALFGEQVAVIHSGLNLGQRLDEWKRVRRGEAKVVVGTRSAVFAPMENIGLIVIDEEQESSYKSESSPRFLTHDVAKFRCLQHRALLLLSSATPSIESYFHAKSGRYKLFELTERYSNAVLPDVFIVDMKDEPRGVAGDVFSETLLHEIQYNLEHHEQIILLLNRRGYHTAVTCANCGETLRCPNCSIAMTYHSANDMLMCHYCSHSQKAPKKCPTCGSQFIKFTGVGTQRVEQELLQYFPNARVLRMDQDTTMTKASHETYLKRFSDGEYDIMIGTQMVAKGLDFPRVTLAGVLAIDGALYSNDYRAFERTFSLLTQVVGRSGRGNLRGRAMIQTFSPDNPVITLAARQDYVAFYQEEIANRRSLVFPPFCDICVIGFSSETEQHAKQAAMRFSEFLRRILRDPAFSSLPLNVIGPLPYAVARMNNKFRYKLIIKCKNTKTFRDMISKLLIAAGRDKATKNVHIFADINPYTSM